MRAFWQYRSRADLVARPRLMPAAAPRPFALPRTFITRGGEGRGDTSKESKATKSEGRCLEEGASRALMRQVGEDIVSTLAHKSLAV